MFEGLVWIHKVFSILYLVFSMFFILNTKYHIPDTVLLSYLCSGFGFSSGLDEIGFLAISCEDHAF
jgi:hypothetical protein